MKVQTTWVYSEKTEAERLLSVANEMITGFYRVNNFIVLPYNPQVKNANIVTFPNLPYNKISRFWERVKKIETNLTPMKIDKKLTKETENLIDLEKLENPDFSKIQKVWSKAENEVTNEICRIIPSSRGKIKKIRIYPTVFGTSTSFDWIDGTGKIFIWLRNDQGVATITEAIITAVTRKDVFEKLDGTWPESEMLTDWFVTKSSLAQIIAKYDKTPFLPTIRGVRVKQQAKLLAESDEFYKKLGIPVNRKVFGLNGLTPEVNKKPLENLSPTENVILRLLIQKAGGIVTFDEFGNELFKDDGNFSLYAISKNIERIRSKLEANGISGSYIQTLRGKGYLLKN